MGLRKSDKSDIRLLLNSGYNNRIIIHFGIKIFCIGKRGMEYDILKPFIMNIMRGFP